MLYVIIIIIIIIIIYIIYLFIYYAKWQHKYIYGKIRKRNT